MSHDQVLRHVPQWREFIGWKLYPQKHVTFPEFEGMRDGLICDVTCYFSFWDRLGRTRKISYSSESIEVGLPGQKEEVHLLAALKFPF